MARKKFEVDPRLVGRERCGILNGNPSSSKRIKRLHKASKRKLPLRDFARSLLDHPLADHKSLAEQWLLNKGIV